VWTDGNGDGLADSAVLSVPVNTVVTTDIWIDSGSFVWTNYLVYVEHALGVFRRRDAGYSISGGSNFPVDWFSHPRGYGLGGYGYNNQGTIKIGWTQFRFLGSTAINGKCIKPIIDINDPYGVFCQLGNGEAYALFGTATGSCYKTQASGGGAKNDGETETLEESSSWGRVKGLFR